jgi:TetR/AcrR family transcriptional repressor of nem operon
MGGSPSAVGRPRQFDEDAVVDATVDVFWRYGYTATTTRMLEAELGVTQSSLYNAFGSKGRLLHTALDRYEDRLDDELVRPLLRESSPAGLDRFVRSLTAWVTQDGHPGCLLLTSLVDRADADASMVERGKRYRDRLRALFADALADASPDAVTARARADLVLLAVLGLNTSARAGADSTEIGALAAAIRRQIAEW